MAKEIIIVTISMGNDGAERVLSELSREWIREGNKVTIVQTGAGNYGVSYELDNKIEIINIRAKSGFKPLRYLQEIQGLIKVLKQRPNAVVVSFIVSSIFLCGVASLFVKNKIVVSERNNPKECPAGKLQQKLRDWAFTKADVCVFQTEYAKKMFPKSVQKKGIIIPNPINGNLLERYVGERRKAIVAACRLHPQKNLPMLIEAFYLIHKSYPEYILEIYGQGAEKEKIENLAKKLGIEDRIYMPGFVDNILDKINSAAMYVSSSDYEGISNSMLEALALGVPSVVTDCPVGGARMMINDGENGILVPVGDATKFAQSMDRILRDKEFAEKLSTNAYRIREKLPLKAIAQEWLKLM